MGYKLHILATLDGLVTDFIITPANIDDRVAVRDLVDSYNNIMMLGDKGYTKANLSADLKSEKGIELLPVQKSRSKVQFPKSIKQLIFKLRRRIETTASQHTHSTAGHRAGSRKILLGIANKDKNQASDL